MDKRAKDPETTLKDEIADIIRDRILKGEYYIGEKIKETSISAEMNVSRTPIREAFKQLGEEGLLDYVPNRGCFAKGFTKRDVADIYTVREALEQIAVTWACERITDQQITKLKEQFDLDIDSKKIVQAEPIKSFGAFDVKAKLGYEISGTIHVLVVEG